MDYIETDCIIEHNGKKFESGGAVVAGNYLIAYPADNGELKDWHGKVIGTYHITSSRPAVFFGRRSWVGDRYYFMRAVVDGRQYSIRGFGKGMIAKGKAVKA